MRTRERLVLGLSGALLAILAAPVTAYAASSAPTPAPQAPTPRTTASPGGPSTATPTPTPTPKPKPKPKPTPAPGHASIPLQAGDSGPLVKDLQKRLVWLGYAVPASGVMDHRTVNAVAAFRIKFFLGSTGVVTAKVWKSLQGLSASMGSLPKACRSGLALCIDKTEKLVRMVRNGKVVLTTDARFGGPGFSTREGVFHVYSKARDHTSSLYHTWMPLAMFFSGGQAVHYSPYFRAVGYNGHSHGCVNIRDWAAVTTMFDTVRIGTTVFIYRS